MKSDSDLLARQALTDLVGRLLLAPPAAPTWAEVTALPDLAALVGEQPEALAIAYETVFGRNVYPYESLYRDEELMLNTEAASRVAAFYAECAFTPTTTVGAPDHLGLELIFLARLMATEVTASAAGDQALQRWARQRAAAFLHTHLAVWTPIWASAVQRVADHAFYRTLAALVIDLIGSELERLAGEYVRATELIPLHPVTAAAEIDLAALIQRLITPISAGMFLSRADLSALARALGLSLPIGDRQSMARALFETAGQFELIDALIRAFDQMMASEMDTLAQLSATYPSWQPLLEPWLIRLSASRALLTSSADVSGEAQP